MFVLIQRKFQLLNTANFLEYLLIFLSRGCSDMRKPKRRYKRLTIISKNIDLLKLSSIQVYNNGQMRVMFRKNRRMCRDGKLIDVISSLEQSLYVDVQLFSRFLQVI